VSARLSPQSIIRVTDGWTEYREIRGTIDPRIGSAQVLNDDLRERWPAFARRFSAPRKRHYRRNYWRKFPHYHAYRFRNQHSCNLETRHEECRNGANFDYADLVSSEAHSISRAASCDTPARAGEPRKPVQIRTRERERERERETKRSERKKRADLQTEAITINQSAEDV